MPMAREGREHERVTRGVGVYSASMCVFNGFLCVWDQISVTIFARKLKIFLGA